MNRLQRWILASGCLAVAVVMHLAFCVWWSSDRNVWPILGPLGVRETEGWVEIAKTSKLLSVPIGSYSRALVFGIAVPLALLAMGGALVAGGRRRDSTRAE